MHRWLRRTPSVFGMVHVWPSPGTPLAAKSTNSFSGHKLSSQTGPAYDIRTAVNKAVAEAKIYEKHGLDGVIVENMWDIPYTKEVGPEVISFMTRVCCEVRRATSLPIGLQVLAGCNKEAVAIALAAEVQFVRVEGFVFGHVADEGYTDACAGELLRYRKMIGAHHIGVVADVKKKHSSHAITSDLSVEETAKAAEFFLADGIVLTGSATGKPAIPAEVDSVKSEVNIPVLVGSGVTHSNVAEYSKADAIIVGSHFKVDGDWQNPLCEERITTFMATWESTHELPKMSPRTTNIAC